MKFLKLKEDAIIPKRATKFAAAYDVYANETVSLQPNEVKVIPTGITFTEMKEDQYLQMSLRSGSSIKRPFLMPNGVGIIDSDYEGNEIGIILYNRSNSIATVDKGERLAQMVLLNYNIVEDEDAPTTERESGFGSTGDR